MQWGASWDAHLQPPPSGSAASPAAPGRSGSLAACGGTTARRGWGEAAGGGGAEASRAPWGEGPSPWDPDAAGAGPGETRLLPKPGAPGPTTLCPQRPLCKRVGWQQRPLSPAQRGGPPHVRRARFLPRAEGGPTRGPGASNPGGMAAPPPSAECQFTTQRAWAEISAPLGSPCPLPNQWPQPQISAPAKRTQVGWAPLGAQEKSQPASSHTPPQQPGARAQGPMGAHQAAGPSNPYEETPTSQRGPRPTKICQPAGARTQALLHTGEPRVAESHPGPGGERREEEASRPGPPASHSPPQKSLHGFRPPGTQQGLHLPQAACRPPLASPKPSALPYPAPRDTGEDARGPRRRTVRGQAGLREGPEVRPEAPGP